MKESNIAIKIRRWFRLDMGGAAAVGAGTWYYLDQQAADEKGAGAEQTGTVSISWGAWQAGLP